MYQVSTFHSEKSLSNQNVHLQLLESNVTNRVSKTALKEIAITSHALHLGKWDFHCSQEKVFMLSPKSDLCLPRINMELNIL